MSKILRLIRNAETFVLKSRRVEHVRARKGYGGSNRSYIFPVRQTYDGEVYAAGMFRHVEEVLESGIYSFL